MAITLPAATGILAASTEAAFFLRGLHADVLTYGTAWPIVKVQQDEMYQPHRRRDEMTYEAFKAEYTKIFNAMMSYSPDQVGAGHFSEKMADLADEYPEFEQRLEEEC